MTLGVGMPFCQTGAGDTPMLHLQMGIALIALAPILIAFFFAQKQFIRGIALTGIKG